MKESQNAMRKEFRIVSYTDGGRRKTTMNKLLNTIKAKRYSNALYYTIYDALELPKDKKLRKGLMFTAVAALILTLITGIWLTSFGMLLVYLPIFILIVAITENQRLRYVEKIENYDDYYKVYRKPGSGARWMTEEDKEKALNMYTDINEITDFILGKDEKNRLCAAKKFGADYTAIFGPTGLGKGVDHMVPRHLQALAAGRSIYSSSTKDDNFKITWGIAGHLGYVRKIVICDPHFLKNSDSVDYLALIKGDNAEKTTLAHTLAQVMLDNTPNPTYDFWYEGAENLQASMMLLYAGNKAIPEKDRNIGGIYRFLSQHTDVDEFCEYMDTFITPDHPAYEGYSFFKTKKGGSETAKLQTIQGLGYKLRALQTDDAKAIMSIKDIDLSLPGKRKCIYYVISSANINPYKFIASMFFTMSFMELENAARENGGKLKVPVDFLFDELEAVGTIPRFKETIDTIRAIGVRMTLCTQSLKQLDDLYGENARASILNNCATQILINTSEEGNEATAKHFSTLAGRFTALVDTKDGKGNKMTKEQQMDLFPLDRALHMTPDEVFVYLQGRKGVLMLKPQHYWDDYPGSKAEIYNDHDGKTYHAHPLLQYREDISMSDHKPLWRKKQQREKREKAVKRERAKKNVSSSGYEYEEV